MTHPSHARPKFDTLFADARHYRGDCRLVVTAIRRGWLADAPQADRDALAARFEQVTSERWAADPRQHNVRALLAEFAVLLAMTNRNQQQDHQAIDEAMARECGWEVRTTGRPRERRHVSDFANRIDASEVRRKAQADGLGLRALRWIEVRPVDAPAGTGERVALAVGDDALWLICPRCGRRREHLYPTTGGVVCRKCGGIGYRDQRR